MDISTITSNLYAFRTHGAAAFQALPGSAIIIRYIQSSYQNDPVRSAVELFLFLFAIRYLLAPKYSGAGRGNRGRGEMLRENEIDELVEDWTPEPLVADITEAEERENESRVVVSGPSGPKVTLTSTSETPVNEPRTVTNLASHNFYNLLSDPELKESAIRTLRTYGVGPCGPPGFYGTQDVHMKLESAIAAHLGTAACIVYAQAFSTISSVIPAFSKRGDIIVADKALNYAARKGIQISRSTVRWYEHNDMDDLERVLKKIISEEATKKRPLTRRFIVAEGLSEAVGDMVDLKTLLRLKKAYKFRVILDETSSYAVLGSAARRGATDQFGIETSEIDMIIGSLAGPLCAGGGFCAGTLEIVEHQRYSAAAYTFSAALPGMLATTATDAIAIVKGKKGAALRRELRERVKVVRRELGKVADMVEEEMGLDDDGGLADHEGKDYNVRAGDDNGRGLMLCTSAPENPITILTLQPDMVRDWGWSMEEESGILQDVVDEALKKDVLITRVKRMPPPLGQVMREREVVRPAIKVCATVGLSEEETVEAALVVREAIEMVLGRYEGSALND